MNIIIPKEIKNKKEYRKLWREIHDSTGIFFHKLSKLPAEKITNDALLPERIDEEIRVLKKYVPSLQGKKLLEIGCGFGLFTILARKKYGLLALGIDPDSEGFIKVVDKAKRLAHLYEIHEDIFFPESGDKTHFPENYFDIVYSSSVLEHVKNPGEIIKETLRVLKPGGLFQFVLPNYGSFWEGHYAVFWLPYLNKSLAHFYVKNIKKRNPEYLNHLNLISFYTIKKLLAPYSDSVEILSYGEDIFKKRMTQEKIPHWGNLGGHSGLVYKLRKLGLGRFVSWLADKTKTFTPLIITVKKK